MGSNICQSENGADLTTCTRCNLYTYKLQKTIEQRQSAIPQSQNNDSFLCLVLLRIPYPGAWRRDSWYSGKCSILRSFFLFSSVRFSFLCFASFLQREEGDASSVWLTNICHPTSFQVFFFFSQQQNLIEVYNEQQIEREKKKKKTHRGFTAIPVLSTGWGWYGRAANLSFLPPKSQNILGFGHLVSPWRRGSRSHPGLRKNQVFLLTEGLFFLFFYALLCFF